MIEQTAEEDAQQGAAMDWLLTWAEAQDQSVARHYWHANDGTADWCGCPLQGEASVITTS